MFRYLWLRPRLISLNHSSICRNTRLLCRAAHTQIHRTASPEDFPRIDSSLLIEEETLPEYRSKDYYPVTIGQVFKNRYRVAAKLGYGSASTVWLCKDQEGTHEYVAMKIYINCSKVHRELPIYEHINSVKCEHPGRDRVRALLDSFEVSGPYGKHICLIHQPMGMSLEEMRSLIDAKVIDDYILRWVFRAVHLGMKFLHEEAGIIHTDLQPNNILLGMHDSAILVDVARNEVEKPSPRKLLEDRTIYLSRLLRITHGTPCISDLSEARFGNATHTDLVMPNVYRAPEVILGMPWSYPIDVWSFGMSLWDLFEPARLFGKAGVDGKYSKEHHLAQMVAVIGPPPPDFLKRSDECMRFWDPDGNWIGKVAIPQMTLDGLEQRLEHEDKARFLSLMRKLLRWKPEDRPSWEELSRDDWLTADLIKSGEVVRE
ncbi:hypothetical protein KVT40_006412 [Elsinoe batatas]|uniref:Protein kinase domain-containing protein n=1 Tax=Elsinoe batatas TaxID=2601811 RepID=A0A8K0PDS0_9PEZI|nr:hypothetical protein KVT40_006412 [Elsinoe batatas]